MPWPEPLAWKSWFFKVNPDGELYRQERPVLQDCAQLCLLLESLLLALTYSHPDFTPSTFHPDCTLGTFQVVKYTGQHIANVSMSLLSLLTWGYPASPTASAEEEFLAFHCLRIILQDPSRLNHAVYWQSFKTIICFPVIFINYWHISSASPEYRWGNWRANILNFSRTFAWEQLLDLSLKYSI